MCARARACVRACARARAWGGGGWRACVRVCVSGLQKIFDNEGSGKFRMRVPK